MCDECLSIEPKTRSIEKSLFDFIWKGKKRRKTQAHALALKNQLKTYHFRWNGSHLKKMFPSKDIKFPLTHKYLMWVMWRRIKTDVLLHNSWIPHFFIWKAIKMPYKFYHSFWPIRVRLGEGLCYEIHEFKGSFSATISSWHFNNHNLHFHF